MLEQIEWGVQDGPITKNGVLPVTIVQLQIFELTRDRENSLKNQGFEKSNY